MNKRNIIRNAVSAVTFGACYSLISYLFDKTADFAEILISTVAYFVVMSLLYLIAPKLRK